MKNLIIWVTKAAEQDIQEILGMCKGGGRQNATNQPSHSHSHHSPCANHRSAVPNVVAASSQCFSFAREPGKIDDDHSCSAWDRLSDVIDLIGGVDVFV